MQILEVFSHSCVITSLTTKGECVCDRSSLSKLSDLHISLLQSLLPGFNKRKEINVDASEQLFRFPVPNE